MRRFNVSVVCGAGPERVGLSFSHRGFLVAWCVSGRPLRALVRASGVATFFLIGMAPARTPLGAQRQQEVTQQGLLIAPFKSADKKVGNKVADEIRGRVEKAGSKRDLEVVDERSLTTALFNACLLYT